MGVIIPGDFKVVHIKRYFTLNVFVLTRFHCNVLLQDAVLISASESGDVMTVVSLLNNGADVQTEDEVYIHFLVLIYTLCDLAFLC